MANLKIDLIAAGLFGLSSLHSQGQQLTYNFDSDPVGQLPAKFHSARIGQGSEGKWVVTADPSAPSKPNVVTQTSADKTDYRFPLLIADEGSVEWNAR